MRIESRIIFTGIDYVKETCYDITDSRDKAIELIKNNKIDEAVELLTLSHNYTDRIISDLCTDLDELDYRIREMTTDPKYTNTLDKIKRLILIDTGVGDISFIGAMMDELIEVIDHCLSKENIITQTSIAFNLKGYYTEEYLKKNYNERTFDTLVEIAQELDLKEGYDIRDTIEDVIIEFDIFFKDIEENISDDIVTKDDGCIEVQYTTEPEELAAELSVSNCTNNATEEIVNENQE